MTNTSKGLSLNTSWMPQLPAARTRLVVLADANAWAARRAELPALDPAERARVERLRFQPDRELRELAYALHRLVASWWLQRTAADLVMARLANGAPVVLDAGGNALAETSLSHATHHVAIGLSAPGDRIGIDVEDPASPAAANLQQIRDIVLSAEESAQEDEVLLATWVRKEALLKATRQGLSVDLASFTAPQARPVQGLAGCSLRSWAFRGQPGHPALLGWACEDAGGHLLLLQPDAPRFDTLAVHLSD